MADRVESVFSVFNNRFYSEELAKCRDARLLVFSLSLVLQYYFHQYLSRLHLNQRLLLIAIEMQKYKFLCQITQYCESRYNIMFLPYLQ